MWCLGLGIFVAAMSVWFREKKVELPVIAISTALLFALPNIRNSQPGIPLTGTKSDISVKVYGPTTTSPTMPLDLGSSTSKSGSVNGAPNGIPHNVPGNGEWGRGTEWEWGGGMHLDYSFCTQSIAMFFIRNGNVFLMYLNGETSTQGAEIYSNS
jgi:hypothetical protein